MMHVHRVQTTAANGTNCLKNCSLDLLSLVVGRNVIIIIILDAAVCNAIIVTFVATALFKYITHIPIFTNTKWQCYL